MVVTARDVVERILGSEVVDGGRMQAAAALTAYVERRIQSALAEQKPSPDKTPEPSKLEQVARAVKARRERGADHIDVARAAIEALKTHPAEFVYGGDFVEPWLLPSSINRYLNAILSEAEGK